MPDASTNNARGLEKEKSINFVHLRNSKMVQREDDVYEK